jgi:hypothetical protein
MVLEPLLVFNFSLRYHFNLANSLKSLWSHVLIDYIGLSLDLLVERCGYKCLLRLLSNFWFFEFSAFFRAHNDSLDCFSTVISLLNSRWKSL